MIDIGINDIKCRLTFKYGKHLKYCLKFLIIINNILLVLNVCSI